MLIQKKIGYLNVKDANNKIIDWLELEWYETNKRILHKNTQSGKEIILKFLQENQQLTEGDILFEDESSIIAVELIPCDTIIIKPTSMNEMAMICYEIGNKHAPLFYYNDELLVPFEKPLYQSLINSGYEINTDRRKLINRLATTVASHVGISETLLTKADQP